MSELSKAKNNNISKVVSDSKLSFLTLKVQEQVRHIRSGLAIVNPA